MAKLTNKMSESTTKSLVTEVLRRKADDAPALRELSERVIGAQLAESDRQLDEAEIPANEGSTMDDDSCPPNPATT